MTTEFRVLGPTEVVVDGRAVDVGHARPRAVLAVLLAEANRVVTVDQLVDRVWGVESAPDDPRGALRTYVSLLRRALAPAEGVALVRRSPGYTAVLDERRVDLHHFRDLLAQARTAGDDDRAAALTRQALELWRGEPFAGLDTPWINATRQSLLVERQAARLDLTDLQLRLGRHAVLLSELARQAVEHPLDERVAGQLMLALYRSGRQADALTHYQRFHRQLADEVGIDPGPALQRLHQRILTTDPALATPVPGQAPDPATGHPRPPAVPRQLPAAPRLFTGRNRELTLLTKSIDERAGSGATPVISAIGGAGGIGKTWLALHWAHQNLDRFPDGQLYVDLRGFDPSGQPTPPETARHGLLHALGVAPAAVPSDPDTQAGLYRSLLADRHMLIVLDNARDTAQVTPLLPGSPTCTVLVTSRRRLTGLISAHGAHALDLDVVGEDEASLLLARHLGEDRLAAEPDAALALLAGCAGLPLAIGIAAARATTRPKLSLAVLAQELRDASARLDALESGDLAANVRAALSWSYDALSSDAARVLGLLALAPGPDIGTPAAASLTSVPTGRLRAVLRELEDASLLQQHAPGRYRMHDLIRLYAAERAERDHTPADRQAALLRAVDFYTHTAYAADRLLDPNRAPIRLAPPTADVSPHDLADDPAAMAWFQAEHPNLLAAHEVAATRHWHAAVWQLAWTLTNFHLRRGHRHHELAVWQAALRAADHLPDPTARNLAHQHLGLTHADLGHYEEANEHLTQALILAGHHHDVTNQAHTHRLLAWAWGRQGDEHRALHHAGRALDLYRTLGQPAWEALALNSVGWHAACLGDYDTARTHCQAALALFRQHNDPHGEADTLDTLGYIEHRTGRHQQAIDHFRQTLTLYRTLGNTYLAADILDHLGLAHAALGHRQQARTAWQQALELYQAQQRDADDQRLRRQLATLPL